MKRVLLFALCIVMLAGCGDTVYETGMFADVRGFDFYESAVELCFNEGYMTSEEGAFGIDEPVSYMECSEIVAKIMGKSGKNAAEFVLKHEIAPFDFGDWDAFCTREAAAYMIAKAIEHEYINPVIDGAIGDAQDSYAKNEIYELYKMGVLSGDKENNLFRPTDFITRAELAIIVERAVSPEKRVSFDMSRVEATFVAFGDTIGHDPVIKAGKNGDGYDFTELFENVRGYIEEADVACVNQETVFVESNFSGYPSFGSPKEIGVAEVEAGFDVITHATNHAFDRGVNGVLYTAEFWENYDIEMLGIHQSEEDAEKISVIEVNGIRIALLNYTYSLNGYVLPKGKEYMVDLLDEEKIMVDMKKAREISDAIVVFAHWGNEYQNYPSSAQERWAQLFADWGATVIVGHHPHVVQPLRVITSYDGREVPVYYSLGNFISNQNDYQNALCAMADFKIVKDENGVRCEGAEIVPVITHMQSGHYSAYLLSDYTEEMAKSHKHRGKYGTRFTVEAYGEIFEEIVE